MRQFRISTPIALTAGAALVIVVAAAVIGWVIIERLESRLASNDDTLVLAAAFGVARHSGSLVSASSTPTAIGITPQALSEISDAIASNSAALQEHLAILEQYEREGRTARIRDIANSLVSNTGRIESGRPELARLINKGTAELRELRYGFAKHLVAALDSSLDDQIHYMLTNYDASGTPVEPASAPISKEIEQLYHISNLSASQWPAGSMLRAAGVYPSRHLLVSLQEDYESSAQRLEASMGYLSENGSSNLHPEAIPLLDRMLDYARGPENVWDEADVRLQLSDAERGLLVANEQILEELLVEVSALVEDVRQESDANTASASAQQTIYTARIILIVIAVISVLGTLFAAWYFGARSRIS